MIRMKLKITSTEIKDNYACNDNTFDIEKYYTEKMTLKEMLDNLYNEYKIGENESEIKYYVWDLNKKLWGTLFSDEICNILEYTLEDYLELTLYELEKQFDISSKSFHIWINADGVGDLVGKKEGVRFVFHLDEKNVHIGTPHIHCEYGEYATRVNLETLEIMDKPLKRSKMNTTLEFIKDHQEELLNYWNRRVINGESIKLKIEI